MSTNTTKLKFSLNYANVKEHNDTFCFLHSINYIAKMNMHITFKFLCANC